METQRKALAEEPKTWILLLALAAMGVYGMSGQVILIRELLVIFYGNELSLGLIFACWLFWVSTGAAVASRAMARLREPALRLAACLALAWFALPAEICLVRVLRGILGTAPGFLIPLGETALATGLVLAPLSFLIGFTFPLATRAYAPEASGAAQRIGWLYIAETAGSVIGATAFTLLLAGRMSHLGAQTIFGLPLAASVPLLRWSSRRRLGVLAFLPALATLAFFAGGARWIEGQTVRLRWSFGHPQIDLVEWRDTRYQHLDVGRLSDQVTFYGNGSPIFSLPDDYDAGLTAHVLMAEHPAPASVLLIGGGTPELVAEILKHSVEHLDFVELDPALIELVRAYSTRAKASVLGDPRVRVHTQDGRSFLSQSPESYDLVIVRVPDPSTAMLNRFYTVEFFREVARRLAPSGVFAFDVGGAVNYIGEEIGQFQATLFRSLCAVFPHVIVTAGEQSFFLASFADGTITEDAGVLQARYAERGVESSHFSPLLYPILFEPERLAWLKSALETAPGRDLNTDWHPVSYFHDVLLWDRFSGSQIGPALKIVSKLKVWMLAVLIAGLVGLRLLWVQLRASAARSQPAFNALSTIATTGFLAMGVQLAILFAFQNQLGYIYEKVGLVVAIFMLGLFAGGRVASERLARPIHPTRTLTVVEISLLAFCLALPRLLGLPPGLAGMPDALSEIWFLVVSAASGFLVGMQFPLAGHLYLQHRADSSRAAGQVDSADHLGAWVGALVAGSLLIPLLGLTSTCLLLAGIKAANLALLARGSYGS